MLGLFFRFFFFFKFGIFFGVKFRYSLFVFCWCSFILGLSLNFMLLYCFLGVLFGEVA